MASLVPPSPLAQTLSERLAAQLRQKIADGALSPGQRLSEQALSDSLGVSRNTYYKYVRIDDQAKNGQRKTATAQEGDR